MKKTYSLYLFIIGCMLSAMGTRLNAQTTVTIDNHQEYVQTTCAIPSLAWFYIMTETTGYTVTDSVDYYVDFGDGNDTSFTVVQNFNLPFGNTYVQLGHTYQAQGNYAVQYIATLPDGNADTVNTGVMITTTCNNVTGRVYVDVNNDCVYNAGDIPMSYYTVYAKYNNAAVSSATTNASGQYILSALPGYTYSLYAGGQYDPALNMTCSSVQGVPVTPAPNASQDFVASNTTTVHISYAGDSSWFNAANCVPYTSNLYLTGSTFGYAAPNDSVHLYVNFGDGNDTLIPYPLSGPTGYFSIGLNHIYNSAGNFNVLYIATALDGRSDTVLNYNEIVVSNICGNVQGTLYEDLNNNCIFDAGETPMQWILVQLTGPAGNYYCYTDANGHYSFSVLPGNYSVGITTSTLNYLSLSAVCPSTSVSITVVSSTTQTQDFSVSCPPGFDLTGIISIAGGIYPTSSSYIRPYIQNISCTATPGSVTFILDPLVTYIGTCDTSFHPTVVGNTLTWNFASSAAYYSWYYWYLNSGCIEIIGNPGLQLTDTLCFTMIINPMAGDVNPSNNTITRCVPALVALDPNVKHVMPEGSGPQGFVAQGTTFDYMIDFQNTGTATARDIFVLDTLDADLDLSSLVITGSSHHMVVQLLPGNVLKFMFDEIWLADSTSDEAHSHGWVSYRIAAQPSLPNMTQIQNTAGIYFDFNAPVITNSTLNTIFDPAGVHEIVATSSISVFPVPADQFVQISTTAKAATAITLTDISGRVIRTEQMNGATANIFTGDLADGVYIVSVLSEGNVVTEKIVVQH